MLDIDLTFLWTAINLLILFLFLRKFLFNKVTKFMDERAEKIAADIEKGQKIQTEGEAYAKEQKELLKQASQEHSRLLEDARKRANAQYDQTIKEAREAAASIVSRAEIRAKNKEVESSSVEK